MNWKKQKYTEPKENAPRKLRSKLDNEFGPGSFATHEVLTLVGCLLHILNDEIILHRAVQSNPELLMQARKVYAALNRFYYEVKDP